MKNFGEYRWINQIDLLKPDDITTTQTIGLPVSWDITNEKLLNHWFTISTKPHKSPEVRLLMSVNVTTYTYGWAALSLVAFIIWNLFCQRILSVKFNGKSVCCVSSSNHHIVPNFCTFHNSTAIVAYAKFGASFICTEISVRFVSFDNDVQNH